MRKQNSDFSAKFISEAGTQLFNSDYFAFAELDHYACYVLADGINASNEALSQAAKLAVNSVISSFLEKPSMRKGAITNYLQQANAALRFRDNSWNLKASLTVVITDYAKFRYAVVGNTRMSLYRNGALKLRSEDQSLSTMMVQEHTLSKDKVQEHEERHNLYTYLGQYSGDYKPFISKKIALADGDIISLYSRGIWEALAEADIDEVFGMAGDDPQAPLDLIEDLIFAPIPELINCYTVAAIFVNKTYLDPNLKKRRKKIITITMVCAVVVAVLSIVLFFWLRHRDRQRESMNDNLTQAIEYITDHNFPRAQESLEEAGTLAEKLWDKHAKITIADYELLVDAVIRGEEAYNSGKYEDAETHFLTAQKRSLYADNLAQYYIDQRLSTVRDFIHVQDYLTIGNTYFDYGNYDDATLQYEKAHRLASSVHDVDGRQQAKDALEKVAQAEEDLYADGAAKAVDEAAAAELVVKANDAVKNREYALAVMYYTLAKEQYTQMNNPAMCTSVEQKLAAVADVLSEQEATMTQADDYLAQGEQYQSEGRYWAAKQQYLLARQIYSDLRKQEKLTQVQGMIDLVDSYLSIVTPAD